MRHVSLVLALVLLAGPSLADEPPPLEVPADDVPITPPPEEDEPVLVPDEDEPITPAPDVDQAEEPPVKGLIIPDVIIERRRKRVLKTGGSVGTVEEELLETLEPDDPTKALELVPSVQSRGEDGYGLRPNIGIRGTATERSKKVTLMEDGVLFGPAPYAAPAAYYFPLMTRMTGLEVYKGPAAIRYGPHTVGGAVNLLSRAIPYRLTAGADLGIGTDLYLKAHGYGGAAHYFDGTANVGFLLEGTHVQTNGFKELDGGGDTGFSRSELSAKVRLESDLEADVLHRGEVRFTWSREGSNETYLGLSDADFAANPLRRYASSALDRMEWDRTSVRLDYGLKVGDTFDLLATLYRHDFSRVWDKVAGFRTGPSLATVLANPDAGVNQVYYGILSGAEDSTSEDEAVLLGANARDFVVMGAQLASTVRFATGPVNHELELGLRYHHDAIERNHVGRYYLMQGGRLQGEGSEPETLLRNRGEANAFAAYLQYGLSWEGLTLTPGVRTELIETVLTDEDAGEQRDNSTGVVLLGLGVHYEIVANLGVLAGVHQGFSPVAPGQDDAVEPERSVNYEAGLRYGDATTGSLAEAIFFLTDYSNLSGQCSLSSGCDPADLDSQYNAGEATVMGLEIAASHRFQFGAVHLPARLSYTFTDARLDSEFTSFDPQLGAVEVGDELPYVPTHAATFAIGVGMSRWDALVTLAWTSPMRERAGQGEPEPGEQTDAKVDLGFRGSAKIIELGERGSLSVYAKLDNVLDRADLLSRRPYGARVARPFSAQLGLKGEL